MASSVYPIGVWGVGTPAWKFPFRTWASDEFEIEWPWPSFRSAFPYDQERPA